MFKTTSNALSKIFDKLRNRGTITEAHLDETLREVRIALLEADVALPVVKDFVANVKEKSKGHDLVKSVSPGELIIKLVNDELLAILSASDEEMALNLKAPAPVNFMMIGLQGSGKTTSSAKLANFLKKQGKRVLMVSLDIYRPAAREQLKVLGTQIDVDTLDIVSNETVEGILRRAKQASVKGNFEVVIYDTAGRLHIDHALIQELKEIKQSITPSEILLVVDSLTGQDAVNIASHFKENIGITGTILTRIDGDNRGGAALSVKYITGAPIKFIGIGEKIEDFDKFHPDRIVSRILGMGDIVSLVEKAMDASNEEEMAKTTARMQAGKFNMNDYASHLKMINKMGGFGNILGLIPGMGKLQNALGNRKDAAESMVGKQLYIIDSMTKKERRNPDIINGSRRKRIATGSGTTVTDINKLLKQYQQISTVMKKMKGVDAAGGMQALKRMFGG